MCVLQHRFCFFFIFFLFVHLSQLKSAFRFCTLHASKSMCACKPVLVQMCVCACLVLVLERLTLRFFLFCVECVCMLHMWSRICVYAVCVCPLCVYAWSSCAIPESPTRAFVLFSALIRFTLKSCIHADSMTSFLNGWLQSFLFTHFPLFLRNCNVCVRAFSIHA